MANISQEVNIEMLEKLGDGSYKKKHPETKASQVKLEDADNKFTATNVETGMLELFTNVSDGKSLVGGAITGVDDSVVIPTDPTFGDLASAIGGISTGKKWASGTVTGDGQEEFITGLPFRPSIVVAYTQRVATSNDDIIYTLVILDINKFGKSIYAGNLQAIQSMSISLANVNATASSIKHSRVVNELKNIDHNYVTDDGFHVARRTLYNPCNWIAYE